MVSLSNHDDKSSAYITLRQAQGDKLGLLQEPHIVKLKPQSTQSISICVTSRVIGTTSFPYIRTHKFYNVILY